MKVFIEKGRAPVRVIDAQTALIQAPPGPVGMQDLAIDVGGATAPSCTRATPYRSAGLETPWEQKPLMKVRGEDPAIAVMQDGRVLVAGGTTVPDDASMALDTAEIYTRSTRHGDAGGEHDVDAALAEQRGHAARPARCSSSAAPARIGGAVQRRRAGRPISSIRRPTCSRRRRTSSTPSRAYTRAVLDGRRPRVHLLGERSPTSRSTIPTPTRSRTSRTRRRTSSASSCACATGACSSAAATAAPPPPSSTTATPACSPRRARR